MNWPADDPLPPVPGTPEISAVKVVQARPFTLSTPYTHYWQAEQPLVSSGVALVLQVEDRALIHPRQAAVPVLYVGDTPVEKLNAGHESGFVVALVPAGVDGNGQVDLDLSTTPIYFGDAELPERIDAAMAQAQLGQAVARGEQPQATADIAAAARDQVHFDNDHQLRVWAADLIEAYSPQEVDLVRGLRAPLVGR